MEPYLLVYLIVVGFAFFISLKNRFSEILNPIFFTFIIAAFSSLFILRDFSIGIDTYTYAEIFSDVIKMSEFSSLISYAVIYSLEVGFILLVYLLGKIGGVYFIFTFFSILIYLNYIFILNKIKINPVIYFMSFFSFYGVYLWSFNILRQMVAVSLVALGTVYLLENKNKFFFVLVFLASLIHYSALLCLIFYLVKRYFDIFYRFRYLFMFLIIFLSKVGLVLISSYYPRYDDYATESNVESVSIALLLFYLVTYLLNDLFGKMIQQYSYYFKFLTVIFSFYIALQASFLINGISNYGTTRIVIYFLWPSVLIWAIFFKNIKDSNFRFIVNILFCIFMFSYWVWVLIKSGPDIIPFKYSFF